jgi:hypothetical protein
MHDRELVDVPLASGAGMMRTPETMLLCDGKDGGDYQCEKNTVGKQPGGVRVK